MAFHKSNWNRWGWEQGLEVKMGVLLSYGNLKKQLGEQPHVTHPKNLGFLLVHGAVDF